MAYQIDPPRPQASVQTVGTRLHLLAHQSLPPEVVAKVTEAVYETEMARLSDQRLSWEELTELSEYPLHEGARIYLASKRPVAAQQMIEITEQLVGITGALIGASIFLWQWLLRMRLRRRDAKFVSCIQRVVEIENKALACEDDPTTPVEGLQAMQEELSEIKLGLIDQYREGYLEGTEMLSAFLKHANDASELISRIVLHRTK